jgi:hypothetical protein
MFLSDKKFELKLRFQSLDSKYKKLMKNKILIKNFERKCAQIKNTINCVICY